MRVTVKTAIYKEYYLDLDELDFKKENILDVIDFEMRTRKPNYESEEIPISTSITPDNAEELTRLKKDVEENRKQADLIQLEELDNIYYDEVGAGIRDGKVMF